MLRAIHRRLADGQSPVGPDVPHHSYRRADAWPLVPGEVAELRFDLLPVSYLFRRRHAIRVALALALAGADRDNFRRVPEEGQVFWEVHRDRTRPSRSTLPVAKRLPVAEGEEMGPGGPAGRPSRL